jgi:hypothetical protein
MFKLRRRTPRPPAEGAASKQVRASSPTIQPLLMGVVFAAIIGIITLATVWTEQ